MLVNTMVLIFHAQNLLHILKKKEKARIKFINFSQKYMGSVFWWVSEGHPIISNIDGNLRKCLAKSQMTNDPQNVLVTIIEKWKIDVQKKKKKRKKRKEKNAK